MPEELLATMPPTMQESMEEGSGPILYWIGCPPLALCRASSRVDLPADQPGLHRDAAAVALHATRTENLSLNTDQAKKAAS